MTLRAVYTGKEEILTFTCNSSPTFKKDMSQAVASSSFPKGAPSAPTATLKW